MDEYILTVKRDGDGAIINFQGDEDLLNQILEGLAESFGTALLKRGDCPVDVLIATKKLEKSLLSGIKTAIQNKIEKDKES